MRYLALPSLLLFIVAVACGSSHSAEPAADGSPEVPGTSIATPISVELPAEFQAVGIELQAALESALEVTLTIQSATAESEAGATTLMIEFAASPQLDEDCTAFLVDVVEEFGGVVDESFLGCGETSLSFTGATIADHGIDGMLHLTDVLTATLDVVPGE